MRRTGYRRIRRFRWLSRPIRKRIPSSSLVLAAGYLLGCAAGVWMGTTANMPVTWLQADLPGVAQTGDLLTELAVCGTYGFWMLLMSTSYLGFAAVPLILAVKGFLSSSSITVCLRAVPADLFRSLLQILLPGMFLLPALFLLGAFSMRRSVRLLSLRWGDQPLPPENSDLRTLAAAAILLLLTAAVKIYVIPAMLDWL